MISKRHNKKPTVETAPPLNAVNLVLPNTIDKKMEAIVALSRAVEHLSKAIDGVNLQASICNNIIHGATNTPAISIA